MDIKTLELIARPVQATQFTGDNYAELSTWIQDKLSFQNVTANADRLYLPSVGGTEILEPGDWVFYDEIDNVFRAATDGAVKTHYRETDEPLEASGAVYKVSVPVAELSVENVFGALERAHSHVKDEVPDGRVISLDLGTDYDMNLRAVEVQVLKAEEL